MSEAKHLAAEEQGRSAMRDFWEKTAPARDEVAKQTRAAVDDIRIKVVEEGWTGKAQTTPAQEVRSADLYGHSQSNEAQTSISEHAEPGHENQGLSQDQDSQSAAQSLYGDAPNQSDATDLYGPDDLGRDDPGVDDPEQDGPGTER